MVKPVSGNYVVISVSDTRCGMAPEVLGKILKPFFTTKGEGKGTGLGLSTVIGIVRSHNGFVEVSSEIGKGTTFEVYLPVAPAGNLPETDEKPAAPPMGRGEQILLVDDEIAILEITRVSLEGFNSNDWATVIGGCAGELAENDISLIEAKNSIRRAGQAEPVPTGKVSYTSCRC